MVKYIPKCNFQIQENNNNDLIEEEEGEIDWTCYRLNLTDDIVIDIPKEMADVANYSASLGHKVSFQFSLMSDSKANNPIKIVLNSH